MGAKEALRRVLEEPSWPSSLAPPPRSSRLGLDYDTSWTRTVPARWLRCLLTDNVIRPLALGLSSAKVLGSEHLTSLSSPVIFAANHSSHLDTSIVLSSLPVRFRHKVVVAAATDYFFDRRIKAGLLSLVLGTIPIERAKVNRKSADLAAELVESGWSLVIFPEGGRTEDGWGQEFHPASAAYLAKRCKVPVVPMHLRGVRPMLAKGKGALKRGQVEVRIGEALTPFTTPEGKEEDARRFSARVERAVAFLGDEAESDWWSARRRYFAEETPDRHGPPASPWRRSWALPASQRASGTRRRSSAKSW